MKLSSRTFGVEFELFFEKKNLKRLILDNIKSAEIEPSKEDIQSFREDYPFCKKDGQSLKSFISQEKKIFVSNRINEILNNECSCYDFVETVLEDRLKLRNWNIHEDCSIQGGIVTMEIVTPVLRGQQGLKDVAKFLNYFGKYASVNESCGLHVHVGASDFIRSRNKSELFATALLYYSSFEELFDSLVIESRREDNNEYTLSPISAHDIINEFQFGSIGHEIQSERYHKINLCSIDKHNTIEFRHMHGVLDPRVVINWIKVCTAYVDMVKENYTKWSEVTKFKPNKDHSNIKEQESFFKWFINDIHNYYSYTLNPADKTLLKKIQKACVVNKSGVLTIPKMGMTASKIAFFVSFLREMRETYYSYTPLFANQAIKQDDEYFYVSYHENGTEKTRRETIAFEGLDIIVEATKRKVASRRGYPKGLPTHAIRQIKKVNKELFGKKMAA